jgi:ABC-type sulfate/molybdate transport systems ATPase subunit
LSESKLNALGLSIKISNNVKDGIPFSFLIIDDPVQSLDGDHATQISVIIRKLIEEYDKQVILLSHNQTWVRQLIQGCQSLNGVYYQMTGFNKTGPQLKVESWKAWRRRLQEVNAICSNISATQVQLQQAEEEIRLAICDISSCVYTKKTGKIKSAHDLNEAKIRSMLLESGIETRLIDRISQTFTTTDESHHTGENYVPNKQRIKQYHSWAHELANEL